MNLISWDIFNTEIAAYTVTKDFDDMSFNNEDKALVLENRQRLATYLHTDLNHMVAPRQTHTTNFQEVTMADGGKGMFDVSNGLMDIDATYTRELDLYLVSFHADCTPILLYCRDQGIVCAIHAGWPGTTKQIVSKVLAHLITKEHCCPKQMYGYIGPCISKKHFEVKQDVIDLVKAMDFDTQPFYQQKDKEHYLLDNKGLNKQQLLNAGIEESHITVSPYCTIDDNHLFYSHRKKQTGRNITIIKRHK